jgi:hypothetical protein
VKYLLLIADDPGAPADENVIKEYAAFTEGIVASGEMAGGERLHGVESATSVRVRNGRTVATDGPFAETKEQLGGYYIVDVTDLDRALELAARIPAARTGVVEVRPIWEM